jgi:DNA-binding transcriptional LysR family regulator
VELIGQVRRLQVLAALADTGTFSAAAHELGITQSAVSQHVAALERELNAVLVDRGSRPVQLTQVGLRLARHGRAVTSQLSAAEQEVLELLGRQQTRLRVGAFPSALTTFVPTALRRFRRVRPDVELSLVDGHMPQLIGLLDSGAIDLAVVYGSEGSAGLGPGPLELHHLCDDAFTVILPRGHRLANRRAIRLAELADDQWIGSRSSSTWFRIVVDACRAEGFTPSVALTTDNYLGVQAMVASTLGVAVVPALAVRPSRQLVALPISGPQVVRRIWAARTSLLPDTPVVDDLVTSLRKSARR